MSITVEEIDNGIVIDHIPAGKGVLVMQLLDIDQNYKGMVALVMNVRSNKFGKKDIVKLQGKTMNQKIFDKIALVAPTATINIIKDFKVIEKRKVAIPQKLVDVSRCPNPKCITNFESVETIFLNLNDSFFRCYYCERVFEREELK
ncbi:MAG: aspartate carbamoyltransferase regulatory subunit [Candidatus Micrarchaeota archaeon]|nr:aspartate carbamoyltransferase regulatory subunit [Candidatus Micrarchaeota archaeon]